MEENFITYAKAVKELLKAQKKTDALRIFNINNLETEIYNHDNWNGGMDYYAVKIGVSPAEYAKLKEDNKIQDLEKCIGLAFQDATIGTESIEYDHIIIFPSVNTEENDVLETVEDFTFWNVGYYKMFISHLTKDRESASNLKKTLAFYGISCFVAHEDIEPTKEWPNEIEKGLLTMDCLCAVITPGFNSSKFCDQEVGFALGRRVLIIPIRKGSDPYGLMGKYQGIQSKKKSANQLAKEIFDILCKNSKSNKIYIRNLGNLFLNSKNIDEANKWIDVLNEIEIIDRDFVESIYTHYSGNDNLKDSKVIEKANKLFAKYSFKAINKGLFIEENTEIDDLPF